MHTNEAAIKAILEEVGSSSNSLQLVSSFLPIFGALCWDFGISLLQLPKF
jgi:hypothetical protein